MKECIIPAIAVLALASGSLYAVDRKVPKEFELLGLAPYVWKCSGTGATLRAEATFPGAYLKTIVNGTSIIGLVIDGTANNGCPTENMPTIEYSIDQGPFTIVQLKQTGALYTLPLANGLDAAASHKLELYFRAAGLDERWTASTAHLRIAGISLDEGGTLARHAMRPKKAIIFGDSVIEGFNVDCQAVAGPDWMLCSNARTWSHFVCGALDCEYGQLGSCGQGMVNTEINLPPLPQTWDIYDGYSATSRLTDGLLLPEPDYVFCNMGNNDHANLTSDYIAWVQAVRAACPHSRIFCIVPGSGYHRSEVEAVVAALNQAGDARVYLIDILLMNKLVPNVGLATQGSYDGGHPDMYGQGVFGAGVALETQKILSQADLNNDGLTAREKADGWISLFDGKTYNGWINSDFTEITRPIENACINPHGWGMYMVMYEKPFSDFILSLDFKTTENCNSGIFIRANPLGFAGSDSGYYAIEVAIDESIPPTGYIATGALYGLVPVTEKAAKPVGQWNHAEITCDKNLITVVLNGQETAKINLDEWTQPHKRPDGTGHGYSFALKDLQRKGYIGLQDHGRDIWYKKIKLKPLN